MKKIVLTVDDRCETNASIIAPILKEYGFRCTFFVTARTDIWQNPFIPDLSWEQCVALYRDGFEIGNHTYNHFPITLDINRFKEEVIVLDELFEHLGIEKPVSLSYPGYLFEEDYKVAGKELLKKLGYRYARLGYLIDQWHYNPALRSQITYFDPDTDDPYMLYCTSILNKDSSFETLKNDIAQVPDEKVAILSTHFAVNSFEINRLHQLCRLIKEDSNLTMCRLKDV